MTAVMPGAEPFAFAGGPVGVVLCHGFTGTTQSMRPWGEFLAEAGLSVAGPRLPGHGTTMREMNTTGFADWYAELDRAFEELAKTCASVFVMGLSMGGTLALRLAQQREDVAGLVVVNAALATERKDAKLLPLLSKVVPYFPGIANDIKKPGITELAYPKIPLKAANSLQRTWPVVRADLGKISCPVLAFRSTEDHVVEAVSARILAAGVPHAEVRELTNSYHVATLDNDAPTIFEGSLDFVRSHTPATA